MSVSRALLACPHGRAGGLLFLRRAAAERSPLLFLLPSSCSCRAAAAAAARTTADIYRQQVRALHGTRFLHGGGNKDHDRSVTTSSNSGGGGGGRDGIFGSLPARTALDRVGRGLLISLPLVGAGFSAVLARRDYRRARQELKLARVRLALSQRNHHRDLSKIAAAREKGGEEDGVADDLPTNLPPRPTLDTSTTACFGVALAADSGLAAAHLVAAYGLYQGWTPDPIINAEIASFVGAVVSTGGGVRGEYLVATRRAAEEKMAERGSGEGSST